MQRTKGQSNQGGFMIITRSGSFFWKQIVGSAISWTQDLRLGVKLSSNTQMCLKLDMPIHTHDMQCPIQMFVFLTWWNLVIFSVWHRKAGLVTLCQNACQVGFLTWPAIVWWTPKLLILVHAKISYQSSDSSVNFVQVPILFSFHCLWHLQRGGGLTNTNAVIMVMVTLVNRNITQLLIFWVVCKSWQPTDKNM